MTQLSEDYCSAEVKRLLREKGFPEDIGTWSKGFVKTPDGFIDGLVKHRQSITHALAMKWLREIKHIYINVRYVPTSDTDNIDACFVVDIADDNAKKWVSNSIVCNNYKQAVEEALKYSLENLI